MDFETKTEMESVDRTNVHCLLVQLHCVVGRFKIFLPMKTDRSLILRLSFGHIHGLQKAVIQCLRRLRTLALPKLDPAPCQSSS